MAENEIKKQHGMSENDNLLKDRNETWKQMWDKLETDPNVSIFHLWEDEKMIPGFDFSVKQTVPRIAWLSSKKKKRGTIIVCAGGGFQLKSCNEAEPPARKFQEYGYNVAILDYRVYPYDPEYACEDALRAIRYLRMHAEKLEISRDHIAIGGFSAGGILSYMVDNHFDYGNENDPDPIERESSRPDATFSMYGSFRRICRQRVIDGERTLVFSYPTAAENAKNDLIMRMPLDVPPAFMAQTDYDDPHFVLDMATAFADRGVPLEYHMFHGGMHGSGLFNGCDKYTENFQHTAHWMELACEWFEMMGF